jgi:hypothetical protein
MSKFLLNLLLQIFQALENSKSNFYSKRFISSDFSPLGSAGLPTPPALACRPAPTPPAQIASPRGLSAGQPAQPLAYFAEAVFLFGSRLPEPAASPAFL